jgi:3D (Asp-Asp-Asp) domain-containing protein
MQSIFTTALMGLFVLSAAGSATTTPIVAVPTYSVSMTAYNAVPGQTDDSPLVTASGAYSDPNIVAARSVDLASELPFGTVIDIEPSATSSPTCGFSLVQNLIGLRVIADSMNEHMHNKIDVLLPSDATVSFGARQINAALALGICHDVIIHVVGHISIANMPHTQSELADMIGQGSLAVAK